MQNRDVADAKVAMWPAAVAVGLWFLGGPAPAMAQPEPYVDEWANQEPPKGKVSSEGADEEEEEEAKAPPPKPAHKTSKRVVEEPDEDEDEDESAGEGGTFWAMGTKVLRGSIAGFTSSHAQTQPMQPDVKLAATNVVLGPQFGYFFKDQLEVGAALPLSFSSQETATETATQKISGSGYGVALYTLYHMPRTDHSDWIVGGGLGYGSKGLTDSKGTTTTTKGWDANVRGGFELLFGSGGWGVLAIEGIVRYESLSGDKDVKTSGTEFGVQTSLGLAFE